MLEATWYWVKVTRHGDLVTDFSPGKQPYEVVLVGRRRGESVAGRILVPDGLVICSTPR